jgi:hypothetical protein
MQSSRTPASVRAESVDFAPGPPVESRTRYPFKSTLAGGRSPVSRFGCRKRATAAWILFTLMLAVIVSSGCEKKTTETVLVPVPGSCDRYYSWKPVWPPLTSNSYYAVFGGDDADVYAVGDFGAIAHYNGTSWSLTNAGFVGGFRDVWSNSPTNAYAVGDGGVYKYNGTSWSPVFNTGSYYYTCVWGADANDIWCGTTSNYLSHWNGTSWNQEYLPSYNYFQDMWGLANDDIYAVGQSGTTYLATIWHYNGTSWSDVTPPGLTNSVFYSVWGFASNNVYVVGDAGTIRRWNGSSWGTMNTTGLPPSDGLRAIRGRSGTDIYAATYDKVYHFNGTSWTDTDIQSSLQIYPYIQDMWIGATNLFVAGETGTVASYDGVSWHNENGGPWNQLQDVWTGGPHEAVAVGSNGTILEYDGTTVTDASMPGIHNYLYGIAGSHDNLYAVGGGGKVLHFSGGAWTDISDAGVVSSGLMDVWASGNEAFAVGTNGAVVHISGTTLATMESGTTEELYGVWGSSASDVFAVGSEGSILHYDGTDWSPMDTGGFDDYLIAVAGSSSSDVYAMASRGLLLHYNGSSWTVVPNPMGTSQTKIWMSGPEDLFGFSYSTIYHFDGANWISFPYVSYTTLYNIAGSDPSNVFAVGYANTILKYGP